MSLAPPLELVLAQAQLEKKTSASTIKVDIIRTELANKSLRQNVCIPFWGKVVSETVAKVLPKAFCLPIGDNGGHGPTLYVEGKSNNLRLSDGCIAWAIPPLPLKESCNNNTHQQSSSSGGDDLALVACSSGSPPKKARAEVAKKPEPVPTHIIDYMDLTFELAGQKYAYQLPMLKDNPEFSDVFDVKCYRATTPWDLGEVIKREAKVLYAKTFLNS